MTLTAMQHLERKEEDALKRKMKYEQKSEARLDLRAARAEIAKMKKSNLRNEVKGMQKEEMTKPKAAKGAVEPIIKKTAIKQFVKRAKMTICPKTKAIVGWSKDGTIEYGPGKVCWQCERRAQNKRGGHAHSCGRVPYSR